MNSEANMKPKSRSLFVMSRLLNRLGRHKRWKSLWGNLLCLFSCWVDNECSEDQFDCGNGQCISGDWFCDGSSEHGNAEYPADCANGADEILETCCAYSATLYRGLCGDTNPNTNAGNLESEIWNFNDTISRKICWLSLKKWLFQMVIFELS